MNLKSTSAALIAAIIFASLLTGCRTGKDDKIVFSDEASVPRLETNALALLPPLKNSLPPAEITQIELLVFRNLLTRHFWDDGDYTAIFLRADDAEVKTLQKLFPDRKPPIKEGYRIDLQPNQSPRDKDTGKSAMILSVDVGDPEADGSLTAIGKWYAGGAVTGFYSFQLKKNGQNWEIQNP